MPVKKRLPKGRAHRITPEALAAWRRACEIQDAGEDDAWEDEGGARAEYLTLSSEIGRAFDVAPWEWHPLDVWDAPAPPFHNTPFHAWDRAQELKQALEAAAA